MKFNVRCLLGLAATVRKIAGKFIETVIRKNCKVQVKKPATLLNIFYFTSIFQGILLSLDKYNIFKN